MAQDAQLARDTERQLLAISEACIAQEHAAAAQLLDPHHSLRYPAYIRMVDAYRALRTESKGKRLAVITHRKKMRDDKLLMP
jgi:hypothetical protein